MRRPWHAVRIVGRFVEPCAAVALVATLIAGGVEAVDEFATPLPVAASVGFSALWAAPIALVVLLGLRLLWLGWRPRHLYEASLEPPGGSPRMAAWLVTAALGLAGLIATTFVAGAVNARAFKHAQIVGLATTLVTAVAAVVLVASAGPAATVFTAGFRALDRRRARRGRGSLFSAPRLVIATLVALGAGAVAGWWLVVRPQIGVLRLDLKLYAVTVAIAALVAALGWLRLPSRARRSLLAASTVAWVGVVGAAMYTRYREPFVMLDIWGRAPVAGRAIAATFNFTEIRGAFDLEAIRPPERDGASHPDVVLITVDTVRADRTPVYGGPARMPALAAFADRGTVVEWALSPGNTTRRSLPTIATGVGARRIRGRVVGWGMRLDPRHVTVAERFRAAGYETAGFFCCEGQFKRNNGLSRGVEHLAFERHATAMVPAVLAYLADRAATAPARPLFLWIHVFEPHEWDQLYPSQQYGQAIAPRYDRLLGDTDATLAPLLTYLTAPERAARTLVVFTSDHGEALGDHGQPSHSTDVYNSQIRVPLVFAGAGVMRRRLPIVAGLVDLAPTLLDLAGFVPPTMPAMDGSSLGPKIRGEVAADLFSGQAYSAMIADHSVPQSMDAIVDGRVKLIVRGDRRELYDLAVDPQERNDLAARAPEVVARLEAQLAVRRLLDRIPAF